MIERKKERKFFREILRVFTVQKLFFLDVSNRIYLYILITFILLNISIFKYLIFTMKSLFLDACNKTQK